MIRLVLTLVLLVWASPLAAESRGVPLKIRAGEAPGAGIVEEVVLYRDSHALVIGIDEYTGGWPRLSMAVRDAELVAEALRTKGFDVTLVLNADSETLNKAFEEFFILKGENPEARLFVWYAGHGHTERGEGFLVPADAPRPEKKGLFRIRSLALRRIGEYVRLAESKHAFAVFDSCFSGTVFDSARALPPTAVTRATTLPVRQFLTSGDAGQTVSDDGTFRELFLRALDGEERADANGDGYVTASEIGLFLTDRVTNLTESKQTPRYGKLRDKDWDRGDFVFSLPRATAPTAAAGGGTPASARTMRLQQETVYWQSVKDSQDPAAFEAYLEQYPDGAFASLAELKARTLKETAARQRLARATPPDRRDGRPSGGKPDNLLDGAAIRLLLAGNSGSFVSPRNGMTVQVSFGADGAMTGRTETGKSDTGKWWLESNRFCRKWEKFAKGHTNCFRLGLSGRELGHYIGGGDRLVMTLTLDNIPAAFAAARR